MELEKAKDGLQKHWEWAINQQEARKVKPSKFNALYANYLLGEAMGYRQAIIDIMVETWSKTDKDVN